MARLLADWAPPSERFARAVQLAFCLAAIAAALALIRPAAASAQAQVCFAIDASGSIDDAEFQLEVEGYASAIQSSAVTPQNGTVEVTIIAFATSAITIVPPTVIDGQATANAVAFAVRGTDRSSIGILTDITEAIDLCTAVLTGSSKFATSAAQAINIATNGQPTTGGDPMAARTNALAAGIDRIDAEAVAPGANVVLLLDLVWPQPGAKVSPPQTPSGTNGLVLNVDSFDAFGPAIERVFEALVPPPPPPTPTVSAGLVTPPALGGVAAYPAQAGGAGAPLANAGLWLAAGALFGSVTLLRWRRHRRKRQV